ncbi:periplasmic sensor diguanylate cyclase/phosphodiesterase [Rhizobium sp. PP-F2F-G48]|uniref:bifunctional diguanylate cyclase/phosphodiesterase n=1 Tax=Rhizobium sp. PP-F2F-G48 TaxID=2135651 RepID=UPI00104A9E95|nr:EAL domain-containing protein [Rhizobium sp. PP-F2F-G48]TCM52609.1 periplasmic sensor diguanylate cyclase/phosphodiesterase [Rhizobium sp. PP-F2F-G48]
MNPRVYSRRNGSTSSVACATVFFLIVGLTLTAIMAHVVGTMVMSADAIDDVRATRAVEAAVSSLKSRISAITSDNSVWDDAYAASVGADPVGWAYENWAKTSTDYPLYDGVVVADQSGNPYSSYLKGEKFDAVFMFGTTLQHQIDKATQGGTKPVVEFLATNGRIFLVSTNAIQPFASSAGLPGRHHVLSFIKELTPAVLDAEAQQHNLDGLRLTQAAETGQLKVNITNTAGGVVGTLIWHAQHPGQELYRAVRPYIYLAIAILIVFLMAVLVCGGLEAKRLKALAAVAQREAAQDSLTGLFNRTGLMQQVGTLQNLRENDGLLTLHLIDLDGFKAVNDAWGHAVGDELIKQVGQALAALSPAIECAARFGGDEFALLQRGAMTSKIDEVVLDIFRVPFSVSGRTVEVGASIGTATATATVEPLEILRQADIALYRAKEDGKGRVVHYDLLLDVERERVSLLEADLREAIVKGDITPVFQPLVSAADGTMQGVEALARWNGANGRISPEIFIPLAEKAGLIDALGRLMLSSSIAHAKRWPSLYLSVNVSPLQLCSPDFPLVVLTILDKESFDPHRLTLEITEGVLMSNPDQARRSIESLKRVGVRFALDDFGSGYASIGALRTFGFDRVKIDRSLVIALEEEQNGEDVLKATVLLATALNIPVTAEGIENTAQADILRAAGCDQFQGYLMGRPMLACDIDEELSNTNCPHSRVVHEENSGTGEYGLAVA